MIGAKPKVYKVMLLTEEEVNLRLESPLNLLNRLKRSRSVDLPFSKTSNSANPRNIGGDISIQLGTKLPSAEELIDNIEDRLRLGRIQGKALEVMGDSIEQLKYRLPEVSKPEKLATIAADMNKILIGIADSKKNNTVNDNRVQIMIYRPDTRSEAEYEVIEARE